MENKIARYGAYIFSGIMNPFFMPTVGLYLIMDAIPGSAMISPRLKILLFSIVFVTTCVLPLLFLATLFLFPKLNPVTGHHSNRILPFFFTAFSIFLGAQLLARLPLPGIFRIYILGISLILVFMFFATFRWKLSEHAAGVGILLGAVLALVFRYGINLTGMTISLILLSGFVCTVRLYLKKHSVAEVITGFLVSCIGMYLTLYYI
jgi:hypothetical protein